MASSRAGRWAEVAWIRSRNANRLVPRAARRSPVRFFIGSIPWFLRNSISPQAVRTLQNDKRPKSLPTTHPFRT